MNDGRLIMSTHTTAEAPQHPYWLPFSFYRHQFEGYQGSNILMYDYNARQVENRGIPVPFETIYGGAYDPRHHAYYFSGMMRGHFYRFDIAANAVADMGQATEGAVYKLERGPDGHIYTSTRTGRMIRINVDTQEIEDLGVDLPVHPTSHGKSRHQLGHCAWHPNGKLYFNVFNHPAVMSYDPRENRVEEAFFAASDYDQYNMLDLPQGICVDSRGVIWVSVCVRHPTMGEGGGVRLYSFDPATGRHISYGFVGSGKRSLRIVSEMTIYGDVLYFLDSNYGEYDPPGLLAVDTRTLTDASLRGERNPVTDPLVYFTVIGGRDYFPLDKEIYDQAFSDHMGIRALREKQGAVREGNPTEFRCENVWTCKLWKRIGAENSQVRELAWEDNHVLTGVCGREKTWRFVLRDGVLEQLEPFQGYEETTPDLSAYDGLSLPAVPGRQYKATATAAVKMGDGSTLIGTSDAMLALYKDGKVFSLGAAAPYGPIHAMATAADGRRVYGVASYPKDLGSIFSFDAEEGLKWLGRLSMYTVQGDGFADSTEPTTVAVSPDGRFVAFGVIDRLGVVYICQVK
jgi:sugar lactone lactonase YvrE